MRASARIVAELVGSNTRCTTLSSEPPLTFRRTSAGLTWVGTAAGPVGGDELRLSLAVGPDASLTIGSAGASIALPGVTGAPSSMVIDAHVGQGASLVWRPEPLVLAARAQHRAVSRIRLDGAADLVWVDEVVLGRHGERCGRLSSQLVVDGLSGPVLRTGLEVGAPGWDGPAVTAGRRAHAQVLLAGRSGRHVEHLDLDDIEWTIAELADDVRLVTIVAHQPRHMRAAVDHVVASGSEPGTVAGTEPGAESRRARL